MLLAWELGAGFGHMANLRTVGMALRERGHQVAAVVRDPAVAGELFSQIPVLAAPVSNAPPADAVATGCTFADLLYNNGCASAARCEALVHAWRSTFELVGPDLILMEFSPLALVASQGLPCRRAIIGTGFYCPPDVDPLPDLRDGSGDYPDRIRGTEQQVLATLNQVLVRYGEPSLSHVGALYTRVDENVLATFRELDHYGARPGARYHGILSRLPGVAPEWPAGDGPRIFAYLRPYHVLRAQLDGLRELGCPTLVYLAGMEVERLRRYAAPHMRFAPSPVNLACAARECDAALLYAPHDSTAALLHAGRPVLQMPQHLEQRIVARRSADQGAARVLDSRSQAVSGADVARALRAVIEEPGYTEAARRFHDRYRDWSMATSLDRVCERLERLLGA